MQDCTLWKSHLHLGFCFVQVQGSPVVKQNNQTRLCMMLSCTFKINYSEFSLHTWEHTELHENVGEDNDVMKGIMWFRVITVNSGLLCFWAGLHRDGGLLLHVAGGVICLGQSSVRREDGDWTWWSASAHVCM